MSPPDPSAPPQPQESTVDLDDRLAALAAGELDDDTARALRARAAADPALALRLARLEQLEQLLRSWDPPAMSPEAATRLRARIDAALDELDDGPLAAPATTTPLAPLAAASGDEGPDATPIATAATGDGAGGAVGAVGAVADLTAARERRGLPTWASGLAIAAALAAVVGTGILVGGLPGGADLDIVAEPADDSADDFAGQTAEESGELESGDPPSITANRASGASDAYSLQGDGGRTAPARLHGVDIPRGELLQLAGGPADADEDTAAAEDPASDDDAGGDGAASCIQEALQRDADPDGDPQLQLLADGTYDGQPAVFVVLRTPTESGERIQVLAYDPGDCSLLDTDATSR